MRTVNTSGPDACPSGAAVPSGARVRTAFVRAADDPQLRQHPPTGGTMATEPALVVYLDLLSQPCRAVQILLSCTRTPHRVRTVALRRGQSRFRLHL